MTPTLVTPTSAITRGVLVLLTSVWISSCALHRTPAPSPEPDAEPRDAVPADADRELGRGDDSPGASAAETDDPSEVVEDEGTPGAPDDGTSRVDPLDAERGLIDTSATPAPIEELSEDPPEITEERAREELELVESTEPTFDVAIVVNDQVLRWLDHYTRRGGDRFRPGLERSGRYIEMFRRIFAEHGVPQDLVYMAHVESAYKTTAYSRAHAKGIYQFISSTARRYGLRVDWYVDERSDPEKSADAAARYLRDMYDEFGDWYLALAGYNGGEGRVRRSIARAGTKDFWELSRRKFFKRETRNYVPAILAAILISKEPEKYGLEHVKDDPIHYDKIEVAGAADLRVLARCAGTDVGTMRLLNPALRRAQTPPDGVTEVRVPVGAAERTLTALADIPRSDRVLYVHYRVRPGDALSTIARRFGVSVSAIQTANNMGRSTLIRAGRTLLVPSASLADFDLAEIEAARASGRAVTHVVRRGETLSRIALRYGTSAAAIARMSGIPVNGLIHPGDRLTVLGAGEAAPTAPAEGTPSTYVVRSGDTLYGIARRYGTTPADIARASGISVSTVLHPGDRLSLGAAATVASARRGGGTSSTYVVRRGDSLWKIASIHDTSVEALCRLNRISRHSTLHPGTELAIPLP